MAETVMEPLIDELQEEIAGLEIRLSDANKRADDNYANGQKWKKNSEAFEAENTSLRNQLHSMTIEKARLEGYIERAREFDPPEEPVTVTPPRNRSVRGNRLTLDDLLYPQSKPDRWYRRG